MKEKCSCKECNYKIDFEELESEYIDLRKKHEALLKQWNHVAMIACDIFQDNWNSTENNKIVACLHKLADIRDIFQEDK